VIGGVGWLYGGVSGRHRLQAAAGLALGRDAAVLNVLDRP
jgi:hypothetical protein